MSSESPDSNETAPRFEAPPTHDHRSGDDAQAAPRGQGNPLAVVGAVTSFLPLVGLVISALGYVRSKAGGGVGRRVALVGIALSLVFGGVEAYVAVTAPLLDSGCLSARSSANRLKALQANPGADLTAIAAELDVIHGALAEAAGKAGRAQVRVKLQLVADDVKALSSDFTAIKATGDTSGLVTDQAKLTADGASADSYCHSL